MERVWGGCCMEEEGRGRPMLMVRAEREGACWVCTSKLSHTSPPCQRSTALIYECYYMCEGAARVLIEMGADVNTKDHMKSVQQSHFRQ